MGKTALLQRFFNILFTRNDPQLIPFYYRIPETLPPAAAAAVEQLRAALASSRGVKADLARARRLRRSPSCAPSGGRADQP